MASTTNGSATNGAAANGAAAGEPGANGDEQIYAIRTDDLWRIYKLGDQEIPALQGINLRIKPGQFISLKGRSGSGKTTLLNCLGGLDQPTKGTVSIFGEEIGRWNERQLTAWRRHRVGFIFQSLGLLPALSAYENVELMLRMTGTRPKERHERTLECLELVGLTKWMDHRPYEMSGGQQQRVAIARALANRPQMIIADEPTGELDSRTAQEILGIFQQVIHESGVTMLMATHDSLSDEYVDQVLRLKDGQILSHEEWLALEEAEEMEQAAAAGLVSTEADGATAQAVEPAPVSAPSE